MKNPLGQDTDYPKAFDPSLLFAIPREQARQGIGLSASSAPFVGYDEWTLYELAWRDTEGSPQMAMGLLSVPASSECIVESKSLKLYANSLYYQCFQSDEALVEQIQTDLNAALNTEVQFQLLELDNPHGQPVRGNDDFQSLDHFSVNPSQHAAARLCLSSKSALSDQKYKTNRFRSLCPVTGQPDWASIYISLHANQIDQASLAQYLAGYSEHQGFHENCVERIYLELLEQFQPRHLCVAARYTRRGGIDINPVRASSPDQLWMPARESRQ